MQLTMDTADKQMADADAPQSVTKGSSTGQIIRLPSV